MTSVAERASAYAQWKITRVDYDVNKNPIYVGEASPGTLSSDAGWAIRAITYDASNNPLTVLWANGKPTFENVWNNRAALSYS